MIARKTIAAGLVALATLAAPVMTAAPASAAAISVQVGKGGAQLAFHDGRRHNWDRGDRNRTLSPQEVRRVLRGQGYRQINYLDRRGRVFEVRATDHRGRRVGLVVNARNGAVLNSHRL